MQRVDEIASYAATRRCRHGHISAYLGGRLLSQCRVCDNCQPALSILKSSVAQLDLPGERQQFEIVLSCIASAHGGWGQANLVNILRGGARASQAGKSSKQWKALSFRSQAALEGLVSRLLGAEMLSQRQLSHGGVVLELTPTGRAALQDPARLQALLKTGPSTPPQGLTEADAPSGPLDEALHERLKTWRREVAQAAGVPLYVVAHNSLLQQIAAARPQNAAELTAIKGMGPKRLEQYGVAILKLVKEQGADHLH
jgi:ATP-dependent DNA helicase RecQ